MKISVVLIECHGGDWSLLFSALAKKSVSARPGPILEGALRTRMGLGRAGMDPTSGPGWVGKGVKQSTWRIWTGPLRTRMEPGVAQARV